MITAEVGVTRFTKPGRGLEGGHGDRARDAGEVGERREDRHHERGVPGRRRHEERDRHVDDERERSRTRPRDVPETAFSIQCRTVSVMYAFFITTVIPRASTMISAAPRKSEAPAMIVVTVPSSPSLAISADHDRHDEEQRGRLGEVEVGEGRQREVLAEALLPEVVPGDEAVDHHQERADEQHEHELLAAGQRRHVGDRGSRASRGVGRRDADDRPARVAAVTRRAYRIT